MYLLLKQQNMYTQKQLIFHYIEYEVWGFNTTVLKKKKLLRLVKSLQLVRNAKLPLFPAVKTDIPLFV